MDSKLQFKSILKEGFKATIPISLGYIPLGFICGVLLQKAGLSIFYVILMSILVFAGSAQFIAASMISSGSNIISIILTTFIVNLRHFLMSSNLSLYIKNKKTSKLMIFSHFITDETFAINYNKFCEGNWSDKHAFTVNIMANIVWVISNGAGAYFGGIINLNDSIAAFVLTSMFITLLIMQIKNKVQVIVSIISIGLSIILYGIFKNSLYIVFTAVIASIVGFYIEKSKEGANESNE
ncbi:AzlC family ABC transporter permease (plasmid) [Paraclostridium ghonii]|uniref:AzlC family ABC transporter permease n=1 Tax=Paraclostridium ghonii TaxID=29358 RepID=UPI00202CAE92|nr:AzlC family ABC transporter permease [Paeniclostridium ghonii]MCM0167256.1 AzlC family ABC transporter permease [Paeniclostridium ghonii]